MTKDNNEDYEYYCKVCGMFDDLLDDERFGFYTKEVFMDNHIRYASDTMIREEFRRRGLSLDEPYDTIHRREQRITPLFEDD